MRYLVLAIPFLPLLVLTVWLFSPRLRKKVPVRGTPTRPGTAVVLLVVAVGSFAIVGLFGLTEGMDDAVRVLLLDRTTASVLAVNAALLGYLTLAVAVALLLLFARRANDA